MSLRHPDMWQQGRGLPRVRLLNAFPGWNIRCYRRASRSNDRILPDRLQGDNAGVPGADKVYNHARKLTGIWFFNRVILPDHLHDFRLTAKHLDAIKTHAENAAQDGEDGSPHWPKPS